MKNALHHKLLEYWRNTLADAARIEIPVNKSVHEEKAVIDPVQGIVDLQQANNLIDIIEIRQNAIKGIEDKENPDWQPVDQVSVLITFFYISPIPEHAKYTGEKDILYPFWIRAIMNRTGALGIDEDTFPYIPRAYLEPLVNQEANFIFSDVERVDNTFAKQFTGNTWQDYWEYVNTLFIDITGASMMQYENVGFKTIYETVIVIDDTLPNAADGIIHLYDHLRENPFEGKLLETLCEKEPAPQMPMLTMDEMEECSLLHLGQMGHEYPLSVSQRQTLYHFTTQKHGDIMAVNGPPGTGKTTLLQSIVANEVVIGALEGKAPRIILASSTNNQAVTNIIDSFLNVKTRNSILYQRWLPKIKGFALFLPSQSKNIKEDIPYYRINGTYPGDIENSEYLADAERNYLERFETYSGDKAMTVQSAVDYLQKKIRAGDGVLRNGIEIWKNYKQRLPVLLLSLGASIPVNWQAAGLDHKHLEEIRIILKKFETEVNNYFDKESFWIKLFSFLPFVKEQRVRRLKQIFRDFPLDYAGINFYRPATIHLYFDTKFTLIRDIQTLDNSWQTWKSELGIKGNPPLSEDQYKESSRDNLPFFYNELETGLKNQLFYLAVHYWEGRWMLEMKAAIEEKVLNKRGKPNEERRWQRFAMLTPCLVSNFYMAPKFFKYSKYIKGVSGGNPYEYPPLYEIADLLIVDEAGQVSPEIGAATFSLAKRALVVGDTRQIEPIWNVLPKVDYANLSHSGLVSHSNDYATIADWENKGFLCSSGSIMRLSQKSSCFQIRPDTERGMLLTEHRRCFDEIIGYCNKIAYKGLLEPMKGKSKGALLPPMVFINVAGESENDNGSRVNRYEVTAITQWIMQKGYDIIQHYQQLENLAAVKEERPAGTLLLKDLIGIITPFTAQKRAIKQELKKNNINTEGLTIGTVHALQGAERPVIIFSSVYGCSDKSRFFLDKQVNMLNVAVSRAKESFIMFGCEDIYMNDNRSFSGQLYNYIRGLNVNLLPA